MANLTLKTFYRMLAAQVWQLPQHSNKEMDADLAESFAEQLMMADKRGWDHGFVIWRLIHKKKFYEGTEE
jgi:hypothetical protein